MKNFRISLVLIIFTFGFSIQAKVTLPKIFSDNLVLQRGSAIPIWGWANQGEKIEVSFNHQKKSTVTNSSGKWSLKLKAEKAGGPERVGGTEIRCREWRGRDRGAGDAFRT